MIQDQTLHRMREQLHRESMSMLAAERAAVDSLTQSYECLALAVRAAYAEMQNFDAKAVAGQ